MNNIWDRYPRPQLKRDSYFGLNGLWDFAISKCSELPQQYDMKINVPYAPQSPLSGIGHAVEDKSYLFYKRAFCLPDDFLKDRVILNFGASDQITDVYINGGHVLTHEGGYDAFSVDITSRLLDNNEIIVRVYDDLGDSSFPYGKQKQNRGGMWYTPVSGIWQSVWLESVPERYITKLRISTNTDSVTIQAEGCQSGDTVNIFTPNGSLNGQFEADTVTLKIPDVRLWSPEDPYLYHFEITAAHDKIHSYFAVRTLEIKNVHGIERLCLNGEPYFFSGVLDQGYWPEGIYTPPSPDNFASDIRAMKDLGFNTLRKHIKIEPELFYYECDRLGMVVFQDMINNGDYSFIRDTALPTLGLKRRSDKNLHIDKAGRKRFIDGMRAAVSQLENHPSICMWTIFNEGWGQFDSDGCYELLKKLDSSRFIDSTSGWFKGRKSDVESVHTYFKPFKPKKHNKPLILSEFGGYACSIEGHLFSSGKEYGYRSCKNAKDFEQALLRLYTQQVVPAIRKGLCAAILTQLSDVEDEVNGLLTYDRKVTKVSNSQMLAVSQQLTSQIKN